MDCEAVIVGLGVGVDNRGCSEGGVASPKYNQRRQDHEPFFCREASCITQPVEGIILLGRNSIDLILSS